MFAVARPKVWWIAIAIFLVLLGASAVLIALFNPRLTRYVESDEFRAELEKETAKGLHFPSAHYENVRRTGLLSAASNGFRAESGRKAPEIDRCTWHQGKV
jgi:hypothetical protein